MTSARRRFLVLELPPAQSLQAAGAQQIGIAYLEGGPGWTTRVMRSFDLDAAGNPGTGRSTLLVRAPAGGPTLGYDGPVSDEVGTALFAAACWKVFLTRWVPAPGWTLDAYRMAHEGLLVAEGPAAGPVPRWCGRDVTADEAYTTLALARARR